MIFGRVMALGLWNLAKYLIVTIFFCYAWRYWLDFSIWVYSDALQINLLFVLVQWFLAELWPLDFQIWPNILLSPLYFTMIWDIDLIFGMRVYNHKLQIYFEICSGWMIFDQLTDGGLWNLAKYLVVTTLFHYDLRYWLDFWYRVYDHKLQIIFEIHSGWMIFGQLTGVGLWNLTKYFVVTTFFSLWFEILTWFLVCECIVMSYWSSLNFVVIEWFWANLRTLDC
jgi:hypothetical protein